MKRLHSKQGQGMMEYILIAAFAVGLAVYLFNKTKAPMQTNINAIATNMQTAGQN